MVTFNTKQVTKNTTSKDLEALNAGCPEVKLQEKSVEYTQNAEYVVSPDAGYDGLSKVNVSVDLVVPTVQNSKTVNITKNGSTTVKPDTDYDVVEQVVVNTNIPLQEKQVNVLLSEPTTVILPDTGYTGITKLTVNHSPVEANTAYTANANGSYTIHPSEGYDATTSVNLTVNVPTTPVEPTKSVEITQNGTTNIIPADGYDAIEGVDVTVNVPSKEEETKSVSYTSNGSYTVQPTEGKTLSEVSVEVNVTNPPTALDISNKFVNCVNQTITQSDIDAFTGWENLTDGRYKFYLAKTSDSQNPVVLPAMSNLTRGNEMFSCDSLSKRSAFYDLRNVDFSKVTNAMEMFKNVRIIIDDSFKLFASDSVSIFMGAEINGTFNFSAFYKNNEIRLGRADYLFKDAQINYNDTLSLRLNTSILAGAFQNVKGLTSLFLDLEGSPAGVNGIEITSLTKGSSITSLTITLPTDNNNTYGDVSWQTFLSNVMENVTINVINNDCNISTSTHLTQESVNNIINALADVTANPKTLTLSNQVQSYVTEEQKTAATAKGWTINFA